MSAHASPGMRRPVRSVGAVLGGFLLILVLSVITDAAMHAAGVFPPPGEVGASALPWLIATAYRVVYGIAGGYVAARLAPSRPMAHALALGGIGVVLSTGGAVAMWEAGPAWYSIAIIAIALPCAWVGGWLYLRRQG